MATKNEEIRRILKPYKKIQETSSKSTKCARKMSPTLDQVKKSRKSLICKYCDEEFFWGGELDDHIKLKHEFEGHEAILGL